MTRAAIYARVSTNDQNVQRQLNETQDYLEKQIGVDEIEEYPEVVSGATTGSEREVYDRLWEDIATGEFDVVAVHEISRLSRLGGAEVYEFIQHSLAHDTAVESLDAGLSIRVDDPALQQTVYTMVANIMGDLAKIEHQQKLERIRSGIQAAQNAGEWTGRAPRGFTVGDDKRLHISSEEFLETREALARLSRGESQSDVAKDTGIAQSTLSRLYNDRRDLYLQAKADDDRVDTALEEIRPFDEITASEAGRLDARIRRITREEVQQIRIDE